MAAEQFTGLISMAPARVASLIAILGMVFVSACAAQTWTSIGPAPLVGGTGPTGRIKAVAVDPADATHWLLGAAGGGIWESHDAGTSWNPAADSERSLNIGSVTFAPGSPNVIYAGTGEAGLAFEAHAGQGILKSGDGGTTWSLLGSSNFSRTSVGAIRVDPNNASIVLAVMVRGYAGRLSEYAVPPAPLGLKRSTDGGVSWTQRLSGESTALEVDPANFNHQYTGIGLPEPYGSFNPPAPSGLYRSIDGGQSWTIVAGPWSGSSTGRIAIAIAPSNSSTVYVSIQGGSSPGSGLLGLYRTDNAWDSQPTWTQIPATRNWSTPGCPNCADYCGSRCTELSTLSVDPSDPSTLFVGGISLWRCNHCDSSASWTDIGVDTQGRASLPLNTRCLAWAGDTLIACTDQGLFGTATRSSPWQDKNAGLSVARFLAGGLHPTDSNGALGGTLDGAAALWTGSTSWQALSTGQAEVAFSFTNPGTNWMVAGTSRIFRTTDGGRTFGAADGGVNFAGAAPVIPVKQCAANNDVFVTGASRIYRTNNFFQAVSPSWSVNGPAGSAISAIAFSASDVACNTYAYGTMAGQIQVTTDGGGTWTNPDPRQTLPACGTGPGYCARAISSIAFDPNAPKTLYVALSGFNENTAKPGHLFKTLDWTAAIPVWVHVSPPVNLPHNVVVLDPGVPNSVYVGTDEGVWHSSDGGSGWQFLGPATGLPNVPVFDLKINPATNRLLAFTFGRGAYSLDLSTVPPTGPVPTLTGVSPSLQIVLNAPLSQVFSASGTPPYTWTIGAGSLPPGMALSATGELSGTPLNPGVYSFAIVVTDGAGGIASQNITLTVGTAGTAPVWSSVGPSPLNSGNAGRVSSIAIDPSDAAHWLVAFGNGGIWESRDAGGTFRPISDNAPTLTIGALAFAPSNPQVIYAATGEATGPGFTKGGVGMLKSTDGGKTWSLLGASTFARAAVRRLRVHPTNANILTATVTRGGFGRDSHEGMPGSPPFGVVKSSDGGVTWVRTLRGFVTALEIDPTNFNNQYAAIGSYRTPNGLNNDDADGSLNGVYRSTDAGQTWTPISGPWGVSTAAAAATGRIELAMAPSNRNTLYASVAAPSNNAPNTVGLLGLYRTDNAWAASPTWTEVRTRAIGDGGYCGPSKCDYSHVISVNTSDPNTVMAGGAERGVWRCTSCGASPTWTHVPGTHGDDHAFVWTGSRFIVGNDGGVWSTTDLGNTWQNHNASFPTLMFYGAALHPTNPEIILAGFRDNGVGIRTATGWLGSGANVVNITEVGEAEVEISTSHPETDWMAGWIWGAVGRSLDGGKTWVGAGQGIDVTGSAFVAPVRKCPSDDDIFVTGTNRVWRTNAFFSSATPAWLANSPPDTYPFPGSNDAPGTILSISFVDGDKSCNTYASGNRGGQVRLTRDGGRTWTDLDPNNTLPARPVNWLAFDPSNPNIAYAAISSFDDVTPRSPGHVFKSTNAMAASPTWRNVGPPLNQPFNVIAVDPVNTNIIYAGSDMGLWRSTDGAATWVRQGPDVGVPKADIYDIKINPATGRTVAFTYGRSAFALGPELFSVLPSPDGGATYAAGPLVPGEWARVQGAQLAGGAARSEPGNPSPNLNGIEVRVNGIPAPIYAVRPSQIVFQVPADIAGTVTIQVLRDAIPSNNLSGNVAQPAAAVRPVANRIVVKRSGHVTDRNTKRRRIGLAAREMR